MTTSGAPSARPRRSLAVAGAALAAVLCVAAGVLHSVVAPRVLWMKPGTRTVSTLAGEMRLGFDPWTARPAVPPRVLTFQTETTITTERGPEGTVGVLDTQAHQAAAALNFDSQFHYVLDQRTKANVASPESWSLEPEHVVDRSSTFSIGLPPGFAEDGAYEYFDWMTNTPFELHADGKEVLDGLELVRFRGEFEGPADPVFEDDLVENFWLRESYSAEEFQSLVKEVHGLDLRAILESALPAVNPDRQGTVLAALTSPVDIRYMVEGSQALDFEPTSGVEVRNGAWRSKLVMEPDTSGLDAAADAMAESQDPDLVRAASGLSAFLDSSSMPVYELELATTDAAAEANARRVKGILSTYRWWHTRIPLALLVLGVVLAVFALPHLSGRREDDDAPAAPTRTHAAAVAEAAAGIGGD